MSDDITRSPFHYFGNKRDIAAMVWSRLGRVDPYVEPFCGSASMLFAAPRPGQIEIISDQNGFVANFWRATKMQHEAVEYHADYPISHIDSSARAYWLMQQRERLTSSLLDAEWPGDAQAAGWWAWGQSIAIATYIDWYRDGNDSSGDAHGARLQRIPAIAATPRGIVRRPSLAALSKRLSTVRVTHGDWSRCLNTGHVARGANTGIFLDPPYRGYSTCYALDAGASVADEVATWAREHAYLRIALCGHVGDYDMPGWDCVAWKRPRLTLGAGTTRHKEAIWFSPACPKSRQLTLLDLTG